ncbi:hypothetical protein BOC48_11505 [Burkholderia pseudomallei]|nr:hypothetical protein BOC48_11505 [Burkholderia pseudomallei]
MSCRATGGGLSSGSTGCGGACRIVRDKLRAGSRRAAEPPSRRAAEPPNRRAAEPPNRRTAEPPNRRTAEPPSYRAAYAIPSSREPGPPVRFIPDCRPIAISRHADRLAKDGPD